MVSGSWCAKSFPVHRELAEAAPAQAVTLACLAGSDGEGQFWCGAVVRRAAPSSMTSKSTRTG